MQESNESTERTAGSSPTEMAFGEVVGCYVPLSASDTGRTKGDPLEFSVLGCLSAGHPRNQTENQRPTLTYATWMMSAIEMNPHPSKTVNYGEGFS